MELCLTLKSSVLSILQESYCNLEDGQQLRGSDASGITFQFSKSLIATIVILAVVKLTLLLSILQESYCNPEKVVYLRELELPFNSPRVLLQLRIRGRVCLTPRPFNSPRVLLQHLQDYQGGKHYSYFQFSKSLIATSSTR